MQRRHFLASSAAAVAGLAMSKTFQGASAADAPRSGADRLVLEIRKYHFASADKQEAYGKFLENAAIAAYNRAGVEPVGVFKLTAKDNPELKLTEDPTDLLLLLPHKSLAAAIEFEPRLAKDEAFQKAGKEILAAPKTGSGVHALREHALVCLRGVSESRPAGKEGIARAGNASV